MFSMTLAGGVPFQPSPGEWASTCLRWVIERLKEIEMLILIILLLLMFGGGTFGYSRYGNGGGLGIGGVVLVVLLVWLFLGGGLGSLRV